MNVAHHRQKLSRPTIEATESGSTGVYKHRVVPSHTYHPRHCRSDSGLVVNKKHASCRCQIHMRLVSGFLVGYSFVVCRQAEPTNPALTGTRGDTREHD